MGAKFGYEAKLFYMEGGRGSGGAWAELTNTKDVTLNLEKSEADVTTRGNNGWKASLAGLKDGSVEFEMVWDPDDAGFDAIHDAYMNNNKIGLSIMDGAIATGTGLQGDFAILNFSRNEPLEEAMSVAVTAKLTYSTAAPIWLQGGAEASGTDTY